MSDRFSAQKRSEIMSKVRSRNTKPEMIVRKLLWSAGYRYRMHASKQPGTPDIVFIHRRKAIFVHGCYWHGHKVCRSGNLPKSRIEFWGPKIDRTRERDAANIAELESAGWKALVVWQCELRDLEMLKTRLFEFLGPPKNAVHNGH